MRINPDALERIKQSGITGAEVADLFEMIAGSPHIPGATLALSIGWQMPGDVINSGDFIPTLTFTLRPPVNMESSNAGIPEPTPGVVTKPTPE